MKSTVFIRSSFTSIVACLLFVSAALAVPPKYQFEDQGDAPNSFTLAQQLELDRDGRAVLRGSLSSLTSIDADFYSFVVEQPNSRVWISTDAGGFNFSRDTNLFLIGQDGFTTLEFDNNDGSNTACDGTLEPPGGSSIAGVLLTQPGRYFVRVSSSSGSFMNYLLTVIVSAAQDEPEVENNNTAEFANPLVPACAKIGHRLGALSGVNDIDMYSFQALAGDIVSIHLDGSPTRPPPPTGTPPPTPSSSLDANIAILDSDGVTRIVAVDSDSAPAPLSESLCLEIPRDGVYFVRISTAAPPQYNLYSLTAVVGSSRADIDGDGFSNRCDNCPAESNPEQLDSDGDGHGNSCDICPSIPNISQSRASKETVICRANEIEIGIKNFVPRRFRKEALRYLKKARGRIKSMLASGELVRASAAVRSAGLDFGGLLQFLSSKSVKRRLRQLKQEALIARVEDLSEDLQAFGDPENIQDLP